MKSTCTWLDAFLALVLVTAGCFYASADVAVREFGEHGSAGAGSVKFRDVEVIESAPYVATSPFAIAFAPKFEYPVESWDVVVLRVSPLVGSHRSVYAVDVGGLGNFADCQMNGMGVAGLFNCVGGSDGAFLVAGLFNFAAFDFSGLQISGFYSCTEGSLRGLQLGVVNFAGKIAGLQLGAVNYAERLEGVQLGLVNVNGSSSIPFLPVLNIAF